MLVGRESVELFAVVGGVRFSPPLAAGCGGSGLSFQVPSRLQLLQRDISNLLLSRVVLNATGGVDYCG